MRSIHEWLLRSRRSSRGGRHKSHKGCSTSAIALVHFADKHSARAGETVHFTAWILNDSSEDLTGVTLLPRSLTNAKGERLSYTMEPSIYELHIPHLDPGESCQLEFAYAVQPGDVVPGGEIVSALQVRAESGSGILWDECQATVHVRGSHRGSWHP